MRISLKARNVVRMILVAAVISGAGVASTAPASAAVENISCPQAQIRREVTTSLPSDWWNTPVVNNLQNTRVITIGGRASLQCQYGAAGAIQRYAPDGATCSAVAGGFRCQTAGVVAPRTFSTGALNIRQTFTADLDRGGVSGSGGTQDIWFQAETRDLLYLVPRNGAMLGVGDRTNRGHAGCSAARFTANRVSLRDIPAGSYICARTNEGRISQFRVNRLSGGSPRMLSLGYTTWQ